MGENSMYRQVPSFPNTEMDWSMPPAATPVSISCTMTLSKKDYLLPSRYTPLSPSFAWRAAKAEQTVKAAELDNPAARGTFPATTICIPLSLFLSSCLVPARYPALKYLR